MARGSIADDIIIRIQADIKSLQADMITATGSVKKLEQNVSSLTGTSAKLDAGLKAFSWTTFSQGALNVSTAVAQVYTSLSNLDRVQLQVKNSMVGVERAEDLLARKTMMLNKEIDKNGSLTEKSIRLRNEIATATEDLTNKEEKLKLAQDQVNDTYILFTSNVINTVFGSVQTLAGMYAMLSQRKIADSVVTAINTGLTDQNASSKSKQAIITSVSIPGTIGAAAAQGGLNVSLAAGVAPMAALGAATRMNPLFLPATIATIAIGIGLTAWQLNEMGKQSRETEKMITGLGSGVNLTTGEISGLSIVLSSSTTDFEEYSEVVLQAKTDVDELTKSLNKLLTQQQQMSSYGQTNNVLGEQIKKETDDLEAAREKLGRQLGSEYGNKQNMAEINKMIMGGDIFKMMQGSGNAKINMMFDTMNEKAESFYSDISKYHEKYGGSWENATNIILNSQSDVLEQLGYEEDAIRVLIGLINQKSSSEEKGGKAQISNLKTQNDLFRQMAELKKKLIKGSELRSFMSGATGFFPDKEGPGFSGTFNKKTGKLSPDMIAIDAWDRVKDWEAKGLALMAEKDANGNRKYSLTEVAAQIESGINKIRHETNFVSAISSFQASKFAQSLSNKIDDIQDQYKYTASFLKLNRPSFGGTSAISQAYSRSMESVGKVMDSDPDSKTFGKEITTGQAFRNMAESSVRNLGTVLASQRGVNTSTMKSSQKLGPKKGSLTTSRSKGSKGRKPRGPSRDEYNRMATAAMGSPENARLLGLTGAMVSHEIYKYNNYGQAMLMGYQWDKFNAGLAEAQARVNIGNQISALGIFDPDFAENIYGNTQPQLASILQREQDQINHQSGLIGETREYVIALRNSPQPELLDRMRYSERLEQISTGATVF